MSTKADIQRLHRVAQVRQTFSQVAEARVREAESHVREIEAQDEQIVRSIDAARAEIAERESVTGQDIQQAEKYINAQKSLRKNVLQSLEKARTKLDGKRQEWVETRREQRIIERLEERRLQEWQRLEEVAHQKSADDAFIGRLVRTRSQQ